MTSQPSEPVLPAAPRGLALVAGGSRGLGLLAARELGRQGYRLAICARDADELEVARAQLAGDGYEVRVDVCDVVDETAVTELVERLEEQSGPLEVALVVAGVIQVGPLSSMTRAHFEQAVDIMLWGPVNVALAVLPAMRARRRGHIGIVSSLAGIIAVPHLLPYSTAKFAALGFSSGLRSELAGTGVRVTTIAPGLMRTGSHLRAFFVGDQGREFGWLSLGAALPVISIDAEKAAARIVSGVLAGRAYVMFTPLVHVGMRLNGLSPTLVSALVGAGSRLLPNGPGVPTDTVTGYQARERVRSAPRGVLNALTTLGNRAAARFNQQPR